MKIKKDAVLREIAGEYILVPVGLNGEEGTGLYVLSDTAKRIWDLLPESDTAEDIVKILLEEYDVSAEELTKDTECFLEALRAMHFME